MSSKIKIPSPLSRYPALRYVWGDTKFIHSFKDLTLFAQKMVLAARFRLLISKKIHTPVPLALQLEPTNYCNVHCVSCPTWEVPRPKGFMDFALFTKIMDDASKIGVKKIWLFLHGEPLLHPRITEMVAYIKSKDMMVNITTNGMRLDPEKVEGLLSTGLDFRDKIIVSFLGYSKESHETNMKGAKHEKVMANITNLMQARNKHHLNGPAIETSFCTMQANAAEEKEFFDYWSDKVDFVLLNGPISTSFAASNRKDRPFTPRNKTCIELWERMTILWNGNVALCNNDVNGEAILGNLEKQSLLEIWNGEKLLAIKQAHKEGRFQDTPFCYQCDM